MSTYNTGNLTKEFLELFEKIHKNSHPAILKKDNLVKLEKVYSDYKEWEEHFKRDTWLEEVTNISNKGS